MLDFLDTATLFAGNTIAAIAALMAMLLLWRIHPREVAIPLWAVGFVMQAVATLLYSQRAELPLLLVVLGGNALGIGCTGLLYAGIARFVRRPLAWRRLLAIYLVAAAMILHGTFVHESVLLRTLAYSLSVVVVSLMAVHLLWTSGDEPQRPVLRLVAGSSLVVAIVTVYRAIAVASAHVEGLPPLDAAMAGTAWLLVTQVNIFITAFGFLLMSSQRLQQRLDELASRDDLTGALNRRAFHAQTRRLHGSFVLLVLDLDHFKQVNDRHGHAAGDAVLRAVGQSIQGQLRAGDTIARWGGEEFVALLPQAAKTQAREIAERIRSRIAAQAVQAHAAGTAGTAGTADAAPIPVTISIGLSLLGQDIAGREPAQLAQGLLAEADQALYRAKHEGRNRVVSAS